MRDRVFGMEMDKALNGNRARRMAVPALGVLAFCITAGSAPAADCPGNPNALGTSRALVVDPLEHPRIGAMQYAETLPLQDHEVVLTFDDGPLPPHSTQVLDILASQCVKATFFIIGRMARDYPEGVRKVRDAGHSIGTHSQNHPLSMNRMPIERARQEIDEGIAAIATALGDPSALAPFFRIPGLLRAEGVEDYLASKGIQTWSADFPADDWRHVSSSRVYDLAMSRLQAKGRGILLLHDIQGRTVAALPKILHELKARGYRIVHVVPATPELPKTPTEPQQWQLYPASETIAISHWPKIPNFVFANAETLPAPALSDSDWRDGGLVSLPESFERPRRLARGVVPLPREAPWPRVAPLQAASAAITLPVPAKDIFEIQQRPNAAKQAVVPSTHHVEQTAIPAGNGTDAIAN
jgi:peptidoglycan/xylan/chitin deacetylase (PgdA/CDA1 family)